MRAKAVRPIDSRFMPGVKGKDLEQSLNFVDLEDAGERFVYDRYTGSRLPYERGKRPAIEALAERVAGGAGAAREKVARLTTFVAREVKWAGFFKKETGRPLPGDRNLTEEELLCTGYGWCNEQARLLCALTQVQGIVSRLVFASNAAKRYGHVTVEVLLPPGWMLVDQSLDFLFEMKGKPVQASRVYHDPETRAFFQPRYRAACRALKRTLGIGNLRGTFEMALGPDPLDGFTNIGYHNHFIL